MRISTREKTMEPHVRTIVLGFEEKLRTFMYRSLSWEERNAIVPNVKNTSFNQTFTPRSHVREIVIRQG